MVGSDSSEDDDTNDLIKKIQEVLKSSNEENEESEEDGGSEGDDSEEGETCEWDESEEGETCEWDESEEGESSEGDESEEEESSKGSEISEEGEGSEEYEIGDEIGEVVEVKEEEDGEAEKCEVSEYFERWKMFIPCPIKEEPEEYESGEENGQGWEDGKLDENGEDESEGEEHGEDEGNGQGSENGEDERRETLPCTKTGKRFMVRPTSEEHEVVEESEEEEQEEDDGNEQGSENGEDERRGTLQCTKTGKPFIVRPTSEEHEVVEESEEEEHEEDDGNEQGSENGEGDEESDISDSEINEYKEAVYKFFKFRTYKIKGSDGQLRCPFCVGMGKQEYSRLLEHAVRVAEGSSESAKQRANHFAMAKYLVLDLAVYAELPLSANSILHDFTLEIDLRKENRDQLQSKYEEKTMAVRKMLEEKDETHRTFFEARNLLRIARDQSKRVLEEQEMLSFDFENKRRRLDSWSKELNKREAMLSKEKRKMRIANEHRPNDELLEARKELMKGLEDMPSHCCAKIGVKRRGTEINEKAFVNSCKKRCLPHKLCSFWNEKLRDLEWHPFQYVEDDKGNPQRVLNENDKLLRDLKDKWGDEVYNAVVAALEYNTSGDGVDLELWNFEEDRKASHCEVIRHIFSQWKILQSQRDEIEETIKRLF